MDVEDNVECSQASHNTENVNISSNSQPNIHVQIPNQFANYHPFQYNFGFNPSNFPYPTPSNSHYGSRFSFQGLLNDSFSPPDTRNASTQPNKKSNVSQKINNSQPSLANKNWSKVEDISLTKAWLYISVDADIGNNQKGTTMWDRIFKVWRENLGVEDHNGRNVNSLGCRWAKIVAAVNKFQGIYERLERHPQSGTSSEDLKRKAMQMYEETNGQVFKFEHCWELMIKNPKWCSKGLTKTKETSKMQFDGMSIPTSSAQKTHESSFSSEGSGCVQDNVGAGDNKVDGNERPQGRKACKDKKRRLNDEKAVIEVLNGLRTSLDKQIDVQQEELKLRKERDEVREKLLEKEMEMKKKALRLKQQNRIMNQDLAKLAPSLRAEYEKYQVEIWEEWKKDGVLPQ